MNENGKNITTDPISKEIMEAIRAADIFAALDDADFEALAPKFEAKYYKLGEEVAAKNSAIDTFYIIYKGDVRKKTIIDDTVHSLGKFNEGEFFGELAFTEGHSWDCDIASASANLCLLELKPDAGLRDKLIEKIYDKIAWHQLFRKLKDVLGGGSVEDDWLRSLTANIYIRNFAPGEYIFKQADSDNSLYLLTKGHVELYRANLKVRGPVGMAFSDDLIGEYGALSGKQQGYDAKAIENTFAIEIPQENLEYLFLHNAELHDLLLDRTKHYDDELSRLQGAGTDDKNKNVYPEFEETGEKKIRRFPWLKQHDEMDCGAACLTMIARYNGVKLSMGQVREMANVSVEGASMGAVCRAAENLGFRARPYKLSYEGLKELKLPAIVHWQGFHWVVLFRRNAKYVWLADPALGIRKLTHEEFKKSWTRYAIELEPTSELKSIEPAKSPINRFVKYLLKYKFYFFEVFIGALVLNVLGLAYPLFIQSIIDNVIVYKNISLLNMMLMGMALVMFFSTLTNSIQQLIMIYVTTRLDLKLLADFYKHVLSLPMNFFYSRKTGDIITRFGENSKVRAILSGSSISTVLNVIMVVVYLSMMFAYSSRLSFVVLGFLPLFVGMTFVFTPIIKRISNELFASNSEQSSIMIESIRGIETIKANSIEWNIRTKWEDIYVNNVNLSAKMQKTQMIASIISQTINMASSIVLLWYGAHLVMEGAMSLGEFMGFNAILGSVMGPIMGLVGLYDTFQTVTTSMERLNDVLELEPEEAPPHTHDKPKVFLKKATGAIDFRNVCFRYGSEDSPLVINNLNLEIDPGKTIAIVGKSGCGKSTMIKMVAGFNKPTSGELLIDGVDIKNVDIYSLRRNIGWVLQDSFLFSGTVAENIALGDTSPDMDGVIKAAK
ncbi:MAG: peptidase domain-containing ABC transporter, partial [Candidatus Kapaibacterium sp.]